MTETSFIPARRVSAHATRLRPRLTYYFVRIFANPLGEWQAEDFEPVTGQPWKPYFMTLLLEVKDTVAEVMGAVTLPVFALPALRILGRKLKITRFWWQSWDAGTRVKLPPVFLDV